MASLLERMNVSAPAALTSSKSSGSSGAIRAKNGRADAAAPYKKRAPKGDVNDTWQHDMFNADRSLSARLTNAPANAPKLNFGLADRALKDALGEKGGLTIKGASSRGNVVQVSGLARGTTAADVEAIFKRCGMITAATMHSSNPDPVVRLTYKNDNDAQAAIAKFHGQPADGRTLEVKVIGGVNTALSGRIGAALIEGSVDVLMSDEPSLGSKLRSDGLLATDTRAHVLVAPPGTDPKDYTQTQERGRGRARGGGRGGRRRGGRGGAKMDVDR
ncbi:uncharacterized protein BXZ73DRAFT_56077 [Epithele typhae]|uniref:uncharacterized protein n=1 Tax=Epithele typhae TaxID=378194 RepID=UPI002007F6D6|nr:uncharacterized protein BXZ73DRAFT_56077 [Epithele typhae]KAH9912686.1 hypothetical protein BXZ73DRAFT_56077 [Epithele typhae]